MQSSKVMAILNTGNSEYHIQLTSVQANKQTLVRSKIKVTGSTRHLVTVRLRVASGLITQGHEGVESFNSVP